VLTRPRCELAARPIHCGETPPRVLFVVSRVTVS
jgi:hypothetical protein